MSRVKKYPIIGGPLDGKYANTKDFYAPYTSKRNPEWSRPGGQFGQYYRDYSAFNCADGRSPASMIFVYAPLIRHVVRLPQDHPGEV